MSSRETRLIRGRRRGHMLVSRAISELRVKREDLGIGQPQLSRALGYSQARLWRLETARVEPTITQLSEIASLLGLELSVGLHPVGDPIRDKGQQALGRRFDVIPAPVWRSTNETLLPNPGDRRSWDRLLGSRLLRRATWSAPISRLGFATFRRSCAGHASASEMVGSTQS